MANAGQLVVVAANKDLDTALLLTAELYDALDSLKLLSMLLEGKPDR